MNTPSVRAHGVELVDLDAVIADEAPKLSDAQRGAADLIAAHQHAIRATMALERAIRAYSADGTAETALTRVRARAALAKIEAALPFIDAPDYGGGNV